MAAIIIRGEDIRKARKARGLTLEEAGNLFGTSKSVFHQWENDVRSPRPEAADRYLVMLDHMTSVPRRDIGDEITSAIADRDKVMRGIDMLFSGF